MLLDILQPVEYQTLSLGQVEHDYIVPADPVTLTTRPYFTFIALEDSVVNYKINTKSGLKSFTNISLPQYDSVYGSILEIDVVSGRLRAYLKQ